MLVCVDRKMCLSLCVARQPIFLGRVCMLLVYACAAEQWIQACGGLLVFKQHLIPCFLCYATSPHALPGCACRLPTGE